eukprot:jgi/Mesen1/5246/ME000263S04354
MAEEEVQALEPREIVSDDDVAVKLPASIDDHEELLHHADIEEAGEVEEKEGAGPAETTESAAEDVAEGGEAGASADAEGQESQGPLATSAVTGDEESRGVLGSAPAGKAAEGGAAAEKPAEKKWVEVYFMRLPRPDLALLRSAIKISEQRHKEKRDRQQFIKAALSLKQVKRSEAQASVRAARDRARACNTEVQKKFDEAKPLQELLRKLQDASAAAKTKTRELPASSEEELDHRIAEIEHRMQHETISLTEEKKLLRDMKALEASRPEVRASQAMRVSVSDSQGQREAIQARLKPLREEADVLKQERDAAKKIVETFEAEAQAAEDEVRELLEERHIANVEQEAAFKALYTLRQQCRTKEEEYWKNKREADQFYELAKAGKVQELVEFSEKQVEAVRAKPDLDPAYQQVYIKANEKGSWRRVKTLDLQGVRIEETSHKLIDAAPSANGTSATGDLAGAAGGGARSAGAAGGAGGGGGLKALANGVAEHLPGGSGEAENDSKAKGSPPEGKAADGSARKGEGAGAGKKESKGAEVPSSKDSKVSSSAGAGAGAAAAAAAAGANGNAAGDVKKQTKSAEEKAAEAEREAEEKSKRREEAMAKAKEAEERKRKLAEKAKARADARAAKEEQEAAKRREKERERKARKKTAQQAAAAATSSSDAEKAASDGMSEDADAVEATGGGSESTAKMNGDHVNFGDMTKRARKRAAQARSVPGVKSVVPPSLTKKGGLAAGRSASWTYALIAFAVIAIFVVVGLLAYLTPTKKQAEA